MTAKEQPEAVPEAPQNGAGAPLVSSVDQLREEAQQAEKKPAKRAAKKSTKGR